MARESQRVPDDVAAFIRERRLTEVDPFYSTWRAFTAIFMYELLATIGMSVDSLPLWCALWVGMGFAMLSAGAGMHEGVHRLLYGTRWLNDLAGALWAGAVLIPFEVHRRFHLAHHRGVTTAEDPEPRRTFTSARQYVLSSSISSPLYIGTFWWLGLRAVTGKPPAFLQAKGARRAVAINLVCLGVWLGGSIAATVIWPGVMLRIYWAPLLFTWVVLMTMFTLPEHYGCRPGPDSAFVTTRTTTSNALFSWFFWNTNYHATHHVHAGVPSRNLPQLHELIKGRCEFVEPSYLGWHWRLFVSLLRK